MSIQKRLLKCILVYKSRLILALVGALIVSLSQVAIGTLLKWFVDAANGGALGTDVIQFGMHHGWIKCDPDWALVIIATVGMILVYIPKSAFMFVSAYLIASITNRLGADIRNQIYSHIQWLPLRFFHKSRIGDLLSRMNNDVGIIQQSSQVIVQAVNGPVMIVTGLAAMFIVSWKLSVLTILLMPPMAIAIDRISRKIRSLTTITQESLGDVSSMVEETVRGVRIIKTFGMEQEEIARFGEVNNTSLCAALKAAQRTSLVLPSVELMGGIASALLILIGGWMMHSKEMTFSNLAKFTYLAFIVADAGKQFGRLNVTYQQILAAGQRVYELIDTKSDLSERIDAEVLENPVGSVEFKDVCFEYNAGEPVLDHVSFRIDPGKVLAIVGASGAGKSTLADLIPRFYDATEGQVLVDGQDVRDLTLKSLRGAIAMVPQETILFSGTIGQNIAYGKPGAAMEEIMGAAKAANAHEFILEQSSGYDTVLGEAGAGLSGGQRQRIAIARALLKDPRILILDEATSSLDAASENAVQEALDRLMRGRSTMVIAHRLSTVRGADRILVLDRGQVVESGAFEQLMGTSGAFAQLYRSQFSKAEEQ